MSRVIRRPSEAELPEGSVRDFVHVMFWLYMEAHRPTLRQISDATSRGDYRGTASTETIRRMLRGATVPPRWEIVEAVYLTLCDLAGRDPNDNIYMDDNYATIKGHVENTWHRALNFPDNLYRQPAQVGGTTGGSGDYTFSDEPPF